MIEDVAHNALAAAFPRELAKNHERYDEQASLLTRPSSRGGSGEEGPIHPLRPSLSYAVALLDTGDGAYVDRAIGTIEAVLAHQETDPDADAFGCWPYYAQQSLDELTHVDLNWAVFLGRELIYALADHGDRLPLESRTDIEAALHRAAVCAEERDVIPGYTNIALMSCYVLVKAGEILEEERFLNRGEASLRELVAYTRSHDGFTEFNSPTYTPIALGECGRMLAYFADPNHRRLAETLNEYLWRSIARQYHPETGKLAGPHARAYDDGFHDDVGGVSLRSLIYAGTDGAYGVETPDELAFLENDPPLDLNWHKLILDCPERYYPYFGGAGPSFRRRRFYDGDRTDRPAADLTPHEAPGPIEARTVKTDGLALGTFTRSHCWGQRWPLVAYWGEVDDPGYLRVRVLRDGKDYLPAVMTCSQYGPHVLGAVGFLTDYFTAGEDEPTPAGTVELSELCVRFEFGRQFSREITDLEFRNASVDGGTGEAGDVTFDVSLLHLAFGEQESSVRLDAGERHEAVRPSLGFEAVLVDGETRVVDFTDLERAAVVFGLSIQHPSIRDETATFELTEQGADHLAARALEAELPAALEVPSGPTTYQTYFDRSRVE